MILYSYDFNILFLKLFNPKLITPKIGCLSDDFKLAFRNILKLLAFIGHFVDFQSSAEGYVPGASNGPKAPVSGKLSLNAVKATHPFHPRTGGDNIQLEFREGDILQVLHKAPPHKGWQYGLNRRTNKLEQHFKSRLYFRHSKIYYLKANILFKKVKYLSLLNVICNELVEKHPKTNFERLS